ncbi:hypothetical protein D9M71_529560 [compost metagenome]
MGRRDLGFRAEQVGGAQLHRRSAQGQGGNDAAMVANAAGGNHRHVHRIDNLRHQRQRTDLGIEVAAEEHPAMAAGFIAHGNDCVAAVIFQPQGFIHRSGAGQHLGASGLDPLEQAGFGQAKVEADHRRLELLEQLAGGVVEGRTIGDRRRCLEIGTQLFIVRFERQLPGCVAGRVWLGRLMAEEVDVERAVACLAKGLKLGADLFQAQGGTRQ